VLVAFEKGHEKVGGRKKGTPNKKTDALLKAEEMGVDPFKMLLQFCANEFEELGYSGSIPMDLRLMAIKEACSYILPKKKAIEVTTKEPMDLPDRPWANMPNPKEAK